MADLDSQETVGPWTFDGQKGWLISPHDELRVRQVTRAALDSIARQQAKWAPRCKRCNEPTRALDTYGLCSRTSESHAAVRQGRAERWQ